MGDEYRQKILIADDSEMNRAILANILEDEYEIMEVENGREAVETLRGRGTEIDLLLLDLVMPEMDGFEVLAQMNQYHWIENIPVIMISAENDPEYVEHAYNLGVIDFINRPFDTMVVQKRVSNTILLYAKQKKLMELVAEQIYEREKQSDLMVDILSHIVEFRNGESGLHVIHIRTLTELLLTQLLQKTGAYPLSRADISTISTASALHDIGKIAIPGEILNKPGRLTKEEFEVMKTHSMLGASMLENLPVHSTEPLVKAAYEICRWHHERYDGHGYPDGLKGDEIPISAQIVSLADVYDALTSERVYKPPFEHSKAIEMILNGECGTFNPLLLSCLTDLGERIRIELDSAARRQLDKAAIQIMTDEMLQREGLAAAERTQEPRPARK